MEYILLIGIVVGVMIAMTPFVKRASQSMVKLAADQIGNQQEAEQDAGGRRGYLVNSYTTSRADRRIRKRERLGVSAVDFLHDETDSETRSLTNMGFTLQYDQINQLNGDN